MTTTATLTLSDFLLARIAEDEAEWRAFATDPEVRLPASTATRVLAGCEAKRAIAETAQWVEAHIRSIALTSPDEARDARNTRAGLNVAMQALALPYADHPDYREKWRP